MNFLQIIIDNKIYMYFLRKSIQKKIHKKYVFF